MLVVTAVATNLEAVVIPELLNLFEHGAGIAGGGLAFLAAAYLRRQKKTETEV